MKADTLETVFLKIDFLNGEDPNRESSNGVSEPHELAYSKRLTGWVLKLKPDASPLLRIAARGQHVRRWTLPRSAYPEGRGGYLRWREELKKFHAQTVGEIMNECGCSGEEIARVCEIILKKNISDPDTQAVEDALCLEFLVSQYDALKKKTTDEKMEEIVRKTWKKMSEPARAVALGLDLPADQKNFLAQALSKK